MKKIYKTFIIAIVLISFASCSKQLTKDPIGLLTQDQIDSKPTLATVESSARASYIPLSSTLNSVIDGWRWDLGTVFRNDIVLQDMSSGDMNKKWNPDGDQPWMDEIFSFNFTSQNQAFNGIWVYDYEGINRVNFTIEFLSDEDIVDIIEISDERKKQLLGEAYFLRAYYYFDLVNNFGGVPLIIKQAKSSEEAFEVAVRASAEDVWAQIEIDLAEAKSLMHDGKISDIIEPWRVSNGAILSLQAKVALFKKDWGTVLSIITELEGKGYYSLNANYFDSFDVNMEFIDNEVIFAYNHISNQTPNNNNGYGDIAGWGFIAPTDDFISSFETGDPRMLYTFDVNNKLPTKIIGNVAEKVDNGNRVFIRYADVLLWKAEALLETNDFSGAIAIINQIRTRARTSPTADGSVIPPGTLLNREDSSDKSQIKDWLISERRVELGFESQRYNDLKRWGIAKDVLTSLGKNFQDHHYLYPLPQLDIDKSGGSIVQNPGY